MTEAKCPSVLVDPSPQGSLNAHLTCELIGAVSTMHKATLMANGEVSAQSVPHRVAISKKTANSKFGQG
jgi:hypothetical protein